MLIKFLYHEHLDDHQGISFPVSSERWSVAYFKQILHTYLQQFVNKSFDTK